MEAWFSAYEYPKIISVVFLLLFLGVLDMTTKRCCWRIVWFVFVIHGRSLILRSSVNVECFYGISPDWRL